MESMNALGSAVSPGIMGKVWSSSSILTELGFQFSMETNFSSCLAAASEIKIMLCNMFRNRPEHTRCPLQVTNEALYLKYAVYNTEEVKRHPRLQFISHQALWQRCFVRADEQINTYKMMQVLDVHTVLQPFKSELFSSSNTPLSIISFCHLMDTAPVLNSLKNISSLASNLMSSRSLVSWNLSMFLA